MTLGKIVIEGVDPATVQFDDPNKRNLVAEVSSKVCNSLWHHGPLSFLYKQYKALQFLFFAYTRQQRFIILMESLKSLLWTVESSTTRSDV